MATAKEAGGLYYVNGVAVDAHGNKIDGAPAMPADTPPDQQPGAVGAPSLEERIGVAVATALRPGVATRSAPAESAATEGAAASVVSAGGARAATRKSGGKKKGGKK